MSRSKPVLANSGGGVVQLRTQILAAIGDGADPADLVLHLSRRDEALIKRSTVFAVDEISFSDGRMRFCGVLVAAEPVAISSLEKSGDA